MDWDQKSVVAWTTTSRSTGFGNPNVQNQVEGVNQWHSQKTYSGTCDCKNLCHWVSKALAAACTHFHLLCQRLQVTHSRGCRSHDQCRTSKSRDKHVGPWDNCQMYDAWSMWSCISKCLMHGRWQMHKVISMQVPIRDGDGCKWISYLSTQKYRAHSFGSWRWIGQSLGGITQCLFVDQIQCVHQRWGLQQHSCS
jgi:hypothetical protein